MIKIVYNNHHNHWKHIFSYERR